MGSLFSTNSSSSNDNRLAATDQAVANRQGNESASASGQSVATGKGSNLQTGTNAQNLAGAKDVGNVTASGTSQVSINDPATAQQAIQAVQTLASQFGTKLTDLIASSGEQTAASQDKTLSAIAALAQNSQAANSGATVQPVASATDPTQKTGWLASLSNTQKLTAAEIAAVVIIVGFALYRRKA